MLHFALSIHCGGGCFQLKDLGMTDDIEGILEVELGPEKEIDLKIFTQGLWRLIEDYCKSGR